MPQDLRAPRRDILKAAALAALAVSATACAENPLARLSTNTWTRFRDLFPLAPGIAHLSAMLITSHPRPVQAAIERYRAALDADPVSTLRDNNDTLTEAARAAAARYFGVASDTVALTDSATMGLGLVYNALKLRPGQELLTSAQDYFVTYESMRMAAERSGAAFRTFALYDTATTITADEIVSRTIAAISPATRVLGLTWVHSSTGLKIPVAEITRRVAALNRTRSADTRVLVVVDGVHGVGNQDASFADLGADILITSCHKWLFGPRGTGVVVATEAAWAEMRPIVPTFIDSSVLWSWISGDPLTGATTAARMTPGGFKAFEHVWALPEAFALHDALGRAAIHTRTTELATALKQHLRALPHVRLATPMHASLSAGIVSFDIDGVPPRDAVASLREDGVIASVAPYSKPHVRLTPSVRNTEAELERAVAAVRGMEGGIRVANL